MQNADKQHIALDFDLGSFLATFVDGLGISPAIATSLLSAAQNKDAEAPTIAYGEAPTLAYQDWVKCRRALPKGLIDASRGQGGLTASF